MARGGFVSFLAAVARESARAQRQAESARKRHLREQAVATRIAERQRAAATKLADKEARHRYLEDRSEATAELNRQLEERLSELKSVLQKTLSVDDTIAFNSLRIAEDYCQFNPPEGLAKPAPPPEIQNYLSELKEPTGLSLLVPGSQSRYLRQLEEAESKYEEAKKKYEIRETERKAKLDSIYQEYDQSRTSHLLKARQRNQEVQELEAAYHCGDPNAVITYNSMVLERSEYPDGFSQEFRLAYVSESKEFVVDYELPSVEVVPTVSEYKYNKSRDTIDEKPRKVTEIKELYQDTVAAVALRTVHEVLEADQTGHVQVVVFNGFVSTVDPATGRDIHPCLISFRATRERFAQINLLSVHK
jgi:restriction system protein